MIRSELVARIAAQNPHLYPHEVEVVVGTILNRITSALADGDRVELRDFGTFATKEMRARTGRNPRTGKTVAVEAKAHIHFKPGKGMGRSSTLKGSALSRRPSSFCGLPDRIQQVQRGSHSGEVRRL